MAWLLPITYCKAKGLTSRKGRERSHMIDELHIFLLPSQWRHNEHDCVSNHLPHVTIVYSTVYSRCRSKKTSKLHVTGLCVGNSPNTGEFPAQMASNAEYVFIWWRHHDLASSFVVYAVNGCYRCYTDRFLRCVITMPECFPRIRRNILFDIFGPKWDMWYEIHNHNLALHSLDRHHTI